MKHLVKKYKNTPGPIDSPFKNNKKAKLSRALMGVGMGLHRNSYTDNYNGLNNLESFKNMLNDFKRLWKEDPEIETIGNRRETAESAPQDGYLLPEKDFYNFMVQSGYIPVNEKDYGRVKTAANRIGERTGRYPTVWLTAPDKTKRDLLIHISNDTYVDDFEMPIVFKSKEQAELYLKRHSDYINSNKNNEEYAQAFPSPEAGLTHAGNYPSSYYSDKNGNLYIKSWDLNDYSLESAGNSGAASTYGDSNDLSFLSKYMPKFAKLADKIGNPSVITTGYLPLLYDKVSEGVVNGTFDIMPYIEKGVLPPQDFINVNISNVPKNYYRYLAPMLRNKGLYLLPKDESGSTFFASPILHDIIVTPKQHNGGILNYKKYFK